jgi:Glyoxalase/Bleomycin resistance protein/Dioxygenase superfamily
MSEVQIEQKSYQMPPKDGITIAHFLTVADVERSLRFYEKVFGGRVLSRATAKARRDTSRSGTRGSSSTPAAVRHLINRR